MSWSVNFTGTPETLKKDLKNHLDGITDPKSRSEYREALDVLLMLIVLNGDIPKRQLRIIATGGGETIHTRTCTVSLTEWDPLV